MNSGNGRRNAQTGKRVCGLGNAQDFKSLRVASHHLGTHTSAREGSLLCGEEQTRFRVTHRDAGILEETHRSGIFCPHQCSGCCSRCRRGKATATATKTTPPILRKSRERQRAARSHRQPTFLNLDKPDPNTPFTVVILGSDREKPGAPETA